jgi:hypothetical protein
MVMMDMPPEPLVRMSLCDVRFSPTNAEFFRNSPDTHCLSFLALWLSSHFRRLQLTDLTRAQSGVGAIWVRYAPEDLGHQRGFNQIEPRRV